MKTFTRVVLVADDGKVLTNGKVYGKEIYLAEGADASKWVEVPEEEAKSSEGEF